MPRISVNGADLFYKRDGKGDETIVFSHGYLMNHTMFKGQVDRLKAQYRCLSFEHRGHGQSSITEDGYELENLVNDAIALIEKLKLGAVHFVGMSTGGFVGMRIALKRPDLLKSLVLMSTSAEEEPAHAIKKNNLLLNIVKYIGWWPVIGRVLSMMFHSSFLRNRRNKQTVQYWKETLITQNKHAMFDFGKSIFARDNVLAQLADLDLPVAVIVGNEDTLTPPGCARRMAETIPGAKLYQIPDAGHSAAIEKETEVAEAIEDFYQGFSKRSADA